MAALLSPKQAAPNSRKLYETYYMRMFSYAMTLAKDMSLAEHTSAETEAEA